MKQKIYIILPFVILFLTVLIFAKSASASGVYVESAAGGHAILAETVGNSGTGCYTSITRMMIQENDSNNFKSADNQTMSIKVPTGFEFNTAQIPNVRYQSSKNIPSANAAFSNSTTRAVTFS